MIFLLCLFVVAVVFCEDRVCPTKPLTCSASTPMPSVDRGSADNGAKRSVREIVDLKLLAGQKIDAGTVRIETTDGAVTVTVAGANGWGFGHVHVFVDQVAEAGPAANPGSFHVNEAVTGNSVTKTLPVICKEGQAAGTNVPVAVAVHTESSNGGKQETGWAKGCYDLAAQRWGWYEMICVACKTKEAAVSAKANTEEVERKVSDFSRAAAASADATKKPVNTVEAGKKTEKGLRVKPAVVAESSVSQLVKEIRDRLTKAGIGAEVRAVARAAGVEGEDIEVSNVDSAKLSTVAAIIAELALVDSVMPVDVAPVATTTSDASAVGRVALVTLIALLAAVHI